MTHRRLLHRRLALICGLLLALCGPVAAQEAQSGPGAKAKQAADLLRGASSQLDAAKSARDRVKALTATVQAYETGLAAMREGLRLAASQEARLSRRLTAQESEIADLLSVLQALSRAPTPVLLAHPGGPAEAVRSGLLVSELTPAVSAGVETLRRDLQEMTSLRQLQERASVELTSALSGVQEARIALSQAMADRTDLPRRFIADPVRTAILISTTETLDAFAAGLSQITESEALSGLPERAIDKGSLPMPAEGRVLRAPGEADAAGIIRPGLLLATRPQALVTTPLTATIRFHGALLDMGNVVILEPQDDTLIVLAGIGQLFGEIGQVMPAGFPIGLMGGDAPDFNQNASQPGEGTGNTRSETLYIEVREANTPVDPFTWFAPQKD